MEIYVNIFARKPKYRLGHLYVNGQYICDTLEDTDRGLLQGMSREHIAALKQHGTTAIPIGRYQVTLRQVSPRFSSRTQYQFCHGRLPRLLNVPGYVGVLIHIGNRPEDTEGCLLVGENKVVGQVTNSTATFRRLYEILQQADKRDETIWITIK